MDQEGFAAVILMVENVQVGSLAVVIQEPAPGARAAAPARSAPAQPRPEAHSFGPLTPTGPPVTLPPSRMDLLHDVEMGVTAELGRTRMTVRDLLSLVPGSVVELDRAAGSPVDLFVNGTLIARGEVVVIDEEYGVRISEIVGPDLPSAGR